MKTITMTPLQREEVQHRINYRKKRIEEDPHLADDFEKEPHRFRLLEDKLAKRSASFYTPMECKWLITQFNDFIQIAKMNSEYDGIPRKGVINNYQKLINKLK